MIHQYQNNGYNIVLDVNSGSVHVVDKIAYDVIGCLEGMNPLHTPETLRSDETREYLCGNLEDTYAREELCEVLRPWLNLQRQDSFLQEIYMKTI